MRMLADNPSIEFLRREAKDLLGTLRESDEKATLAEAQRMIADMYGFRTWGDLKAEVDRRRENVPEAPDGLAAGIAAAFALGDVTLPLAPIRYEYMGRRWCLETDLGRYMLSPVFDWINDQQAEVAVDLQERARSVGVLSPVPVRTPDGGLVCRIADQSWRVSEWMDLGPTPVPPVHSSVARRIGEVLAAVHEVAPDTDRPIEGQWVADPPREAAWAEMLKRAEAANKPWAEEFAALSQIVAELLRAREEAPTEGVVISNCDINPEAVRLGPGGEPVVVHWDFSGPMTREWDLGSALLNWALFSGLNLEAGRALMDGYRARSDHALSLTLASFSAGITGWLTWTFHQACEAIAPESAEKAEFAERALRESFDDPLTVAKLSSLLEALDPVASSRTHRPATWDDPSRRRSRRVLARTLRHGPGRRGSGSRPDRGRPEGAGDRAGRRDGNGQARPRSSEPRTDRGRVPTRGCRPIARRGLR